VLAIKAMQQDTDFEGGNSILDSLIKEHHYITTNIRVYDTGGKLLLQVTRCFSIHRKIFNFFLIKVVGYIKNVSTFAPALQHKFFDGLQAWISGAFNK